MMAARNQSVSWFSHALPHEQGNLLMFGKPLVGRPMAAEHINAEPMTNKFGCGSFMPAPTWWTRGRKIKAATVWLMNVAMTSINAAKTIRTPYKLIPSTFSVTVAAMVCSKPEEETALPRESPPAARIMMVQRKLLKSSFVKMPVPKNATIGMMATTPISPKTFSS